MAEKISLVNSISKGGVGKSFITIHLAEYFASFNKKVLIIDLDHQQLNSCLYVADQRDLASDNQTKLKDILIFIMDNFPDIYNNVESVLKELNILLINSIFSTGYISVIASDPLINEIDTKIKEFSSSRFLLRILKAFAFDIYDVVIFDCPPDSSKALVKSAFAAANNLIIPTLADEFSIKGIKNTLKLYNEIKITDNNELNLVGILINQYKVNHALDVVYKEHIEDLFGEQVIDAVLPYYTDYRNAIFERKFILDYNVSNKKSIKHMKTVLEKINNRIIKEDF
jgi:chromosome partitioning protein